MGVNWTHERYKLVRWVVLTLIAASFKIKFPWSAQEAVDTAIIIGNIVETNDRKL